MVDAPLNQYLRVPPPSDPESQQGHLDGELTKLERTTRETIAKLNTLSGIYAPIADPVFTGDPQAPTPLTADNDTSIATTAFVKAQDYATNTGLTAGLATKAPTAHTHAQSDVTGLVAALGAKEPSVTGSGPSTDYYGGDKAFHALPAQRLVATYTVETNATTAITTTFPTSSLTPATSVGVQILSLAVTTTSATQVIDLSANVIGAGAASVNVSAGILLDGTTWLATVAAFFNGFDGLRVVKRYAPGASGTYTFTVRVGPQTATTFNLNSPTYGGATVSALQAYVIEP